MSTKVSSAEEARRSAMAEHAKAERARLGLTKAQWKARNKEMHAKTKAEEEVDAAEAELRERCPRKAPAHSPRRRGRGPCEDGAAGTATGTETRP